jgi:aldehyde dehydrogenase (NAD+)
MISAHAHQLFINGQWVMPHGTGTHTVINPATEQPVGEICQGDATDVDVAVAAARAAFESFSQTTREKRLALLERILAVYQRRFEEVAQTISMEMGSPIAFSRTGQAQTGIAHFTIMRDVLRDYVYETPMANGVVVKEPVGVCGLITPWNWPMNQVALKVAPALATGCTVVLKPSENSPFTALILAEILEEAGVPAGVFNLINGKGTVVGKAMAEHPGIDMMSLTGSTRAGVEVMKNSAPTIKRVGLELGGKSANIILPDADFEVHVPKAVELCFVNAGQSCSAATRLFVPRNKLAMVNALAKTRAEAYVPGDPMDESTTLGPVVSATQWERVQGYIHKGLEEGATLLTGGPGKPEGLETGYYIKPTIFTDVSNRMTIAQEEIFGPVLVIIPYDTEDDAIAMANDSPYGLSGYVSGEPAHAKAVAKRLRTGTVCLNSQKPHPSMPFGGYKLSGNGREKGLYGFEEYLEVKTIAG